MDRLAAATIIRGLAVALSLAPAVAAAAEQSGIPHEFRVEGSMPVQFVETATANSRSSSVMYGPFFRLMATAYLQPDLSTSIFAEGGHDPLGRFRDNDNTSASFGANIVKRWGAFSIGTSLEHNWFYNGVFDRAPNVTNSLNVFARYGWRPNNNLRINSSVNASVRANDELAVQRYMYTARLEVEQRLIGSWWFVANPRFRYSEGVNAAAGRRDVTVSIVSGLKYEFTENVSFMTLAGFENRASGSTARSFDRFVAGASLDFKFSPRLPW